MAVNTLEYLLKIKDEATAVLNKFNKNAQTTGKSMQSLGKSMTSTGMAMAKVGAIGVASLGLASKSAISFEDAFAGVRKTVDASEEEFAQLEANIRQIAKSAPVSVEELSKIGELAGQLGVEGVDNLTKFTKTVADISVSTNLTSEQASTAFAQIFNIMGESLDQVDRMGSAIVELGNNFATTESDITNFTQRIAGAGKIAGLSTADILGISTAMASVGVKAEAGGTAVQKVLLKMNESVVTGSEELGVFADTVGVTTDEFKKRWETDATRVFADFVKGLGEQGDEATLTLQDLGLANQRVITAFLSLANAGELIDETLASANEGWSENTALTIEAEKRYKTTASQLAILKNFVNDVGITIGSTLLPAINGVVTRLKPAIEAFAKFTEKHPKLIVGILALVAGIGILGGAFVAIGIVVSGLGTMFTALGAVLGVVTLPMLGIAIAVGAVIAIGVALYKNWDKIKSKAIELGSAVKSGFLDVFNKAKDTFISFKNDVVTVFQIIQDVFRGWDPGALMSGDVWEKWKGFIQLLWGVREGVLDFVEGVKRGFTSAKKSLSDAKDSMMGFLETLKGQLISLATTIFEIIQTIATPFVFIWENIIFPLLFLAFAVISRILYEIFNFFVMIFTQIATFVINVFTTMWNGIVTVFTAIREAIAIILLAIWESTILPMLMIIQEFWLATWENIKFTFMTVWTAITEFISITIQTITDIFNAFWEGVVAIFTSMWNSIKAIWTGISTSVTTKVTEIKTKATEIFNSAKEKVLGIFNALWEGLKSIGESIFNAIVDPFKKALDKIREIASQIKESAKKISPFHKSSPSLVELVETGVNKIKRDYSSLNRLAIPSAQDLSGVNSFAPLTRDIEGADQSRTTNNTINVEATINTPMDAEELALLLGNQLATAKAY